MNAVIKDMYGSFLQSLTNEKRTVFVIPKVYTFLIEKEYVIETFELEITQGSIISC